MYLFWHVDGALKNEKAPLPLPEAMDLKKATDFAWAWLKRVDRGHEPDIDGSVYPTGYVVKHVSMGWGYKFVTVQAVWTMYHK